MTNASHDLQRSEDLKGLLSKAPTPLSESDIAILKQLTLLDVTTYSEADVRAEIIDPILRVLGYQKQTYFSLEREKTLSILNEKQFIDYSMTLWSEHFWVIEAKKVKRRKLEFTSKELNQAMLYATHPDINAALLVLCDGRLIEVYDRDESLTKSALHIPIKELPDRFHELQALLAPWQSWFFRKRRILRLTERVLGLEMNINRLAEFQRAFNSQVESMRSKVLENAKQGHPQFRFF